MAIKDGGPAFARARSTAPNRYGGQDIVHPAQDGMSLRDYFAGRAPYMPDELLGDVMDSAPNLGREAQRAFMAESFAKWAYEFADAMLRTREAGE